MPLQEGDTLHGRWRVLDRLEGTDEFLRHALEDLAAEETASPETEAHGAAPDTSHIDEAMELLQPTSTALLRPGALEGLEMVATPDPRHPAWLKRMVLPLGDSRVILQPRCAGPLEEDRQLSCQQARSLLHWLAPAILAGRPSHNGNLRPQDIFLDMDGIPRLAPSGIPAPDRLLASSRYMAPESRRGAPAAPAGGLYGLGVLLYRGLSGAWPAPARAPGDPTNPSTDSPTIIPLSTLAPGIPPDLADAVHSLLSNDPQLRIAAVQDLAPCVSTPPSLPLPAVGPTHAAPPSAVPTAGPSSTGRFTLDADARSANQGARRLLAAMADLDPEVVEKAAETGQPVALPGRRSRGEARELAESLKDLGLPTRISTGPGSSRTLLWSGGLLFIVLALFTMSGSPSLALGLAILGLLTSLIAVISPPMALRDGKPPPRHRDPQVHRLQERIEILLRNLVHFNLPATAASDLLEDLMALEQQLRTLGKQLLHAEKELRTFNPNRIRDKLEKARRQGQGQGVLDAESQLALMDTLLEQRRDIRQQLRDMSSALASLESTLVSWPGASSSGTALPAGSPMAGPSSPEAHTLRNIYRHAELVRATRNEMDLENTGLATTSQERSGETGSDPGGPGRRKTGRPAKEHV